MIRFECIDHVVFRVRDIDASMAFYVDLLGMTIEKTQTDIGLYQLRAGSALLDLVPVDGPLGLKGGAAPAREARNVDHVCFAIAEDDLIELRARLVDSGIASGPVERRYGANGYGPSLYLEDPDNNVIELRKYEPAGRD